MFCVVFVVLFVVCSVGLGREEEFWLVRGVIVDFLGRVDGFVGVFLVLLVCCDWGYFLVLR